MDTKDKAYWIEQIKFYFPSHEEEMEKWLNTSNAAFNNESPMSLLDKGDFQPIEEMLYHLESGVF